MKESHRRGVLALAAVGLVALAAGSALGAQVWEFYAEETAPNDDCLGTACHAMAEEAGLTGGPVDVGPGETHFWIANRSAEEDLRLDNATWTLRLHCTEETTGEIQTAIGAASDGTGAGFSSAATATNTSEGCQGEDSDHNFTLAPDDFTVDAGQHLAVRVTSVGATFDVHAKGEAPDTQLLYPLDSPDYPGTANATDGDDGGTDDGSDGGTDDGSDGGTDGGTDGDGTDGGNGTPLGPAAAIAGTALAALLRRR